jgi:hypothetical protein
MSLFCLKKKNCESKTRQRRNHQLQQQQTSLLDSCESRLAGLKGSLVDARSRRRGVALAELLFAELDLVPAVSCVQDARKLFVSGSKSCKASGTSGGSGFLINGRFLK